MNSQKIKELLIFMFAQDFNAEQMIDTSSAESESFEFSVGVEFKDSKGQWHDAYMNIEAGRIYKHSEDRVYQTYGDPFGRGEWVGGEVTVEAVDYGNIDCYVDSEKADFMIKEEDLFLAIKNKPQLAA